MIVVARDKDVAINLLDSYGIRYINRGKGSNSLWGKFIYLFKANYCIYKVSRIFKPDVYLSFSSPYVAQVSWLLRKPHIAFTDTEHATLGNLAFLPFSKVVCTPSCFKKDFGEKHIRFNGYMELCYLHPNYFTPDPSIVELLGVVKNERYVILRFVSWEASHDIGHAGISIENKIKVVKEFSKYAKVFITSESKLPQEIKKNRISIPPDKIHHALAFADLLYGESATMASECAVLGTPAIFLDNDGRGYTDEEENIYGLVFNFSESLNDQEKSIKKGVELLTIVEPKEELQSKCEKIIREKIDVTGFMVWFIENYPKSVKTMKNNPDYQYKFK